MHEGGEKYIQKILVGIFQGKFCFRGLDQFVYIISLRIKEFFFSFSEQKIWVGLKFEVLVITLRKA